MKWSGSLSQRVDERNLAPGDLTREGLSSDPYRRTSDPATVRKLNSALIDLERLKSERNALQSENNDLRLECTRLSRLVDDSLLTSRAVSSHQSALKSAEEENQRLRTLLSTRDAERRQLEQKVRDLEGRQDTERLQSTRKMQAGADTVAQVVRARETAERKVEMQRAELQQYEAANRDLALSKAQLSREFAVLEAERNSLLSQLSERSKYEQKLTSDYESAQLEANVVHTRHSRVLATCVLFDRLTAAVRRITAAKWLRIKCYTASSQSRDRGVQEFYFAVAKRCRKLLAEKIRNWREFAISARKESEKLTLLQGCELSLERHSLFSLWQALTYKHIATKHQQSRSKRLRRTFATFLSSQSAVRHWELLRSVFLAWKSYQLRRKSHQAVKKLSSLSTHTLSLSDSLNTEQATHQQTMVRKALSCLFRQSRAQVGSYVAVWKEAAISFKSNLSRLKRVVTIWNRSRETVALSAWKAVVNWQQLTEVVTESRKLANKNLALSEHIVNLEKVLQIDIAEKREHREKRLRIAVINNWKLNLKTGLRLWARTALTINSKLSAIYRLHAVLRRNLLSSTIQSLTHMKRRKVAKDLRTLRMIKLMQKDSKIWAKFYFSHWLEYIQAKQTARKLMKKAISRGLFDDRRKGLLSWKERVVMCREADMSEDYRLLSTEKAEVEEELSVTVRLYEAEKQAFSGFQATTQRQHLAKLEKTALRIVNYTLYQRFLCWKEKHKLQVRKSLSSTRLFALWRRQILRKGVDSWNYYTKRAIEHTFQREVNSLQRDLRDQQRTYRSVKESLENTVATQESELKLATRELRKYRKEFEGVLAKVGLMHRNSVSKAKVCLEMWRLWAIAVKKAGNVVATVLRKRMYRQGLAEISATAKAARASQRFADSVATMLKRLEGFGEKSNFNQWKGIVECIKEAELMEKYRYEQEMAHKLLKANRYLKEHFSSHIFVLGEKTIMKNCVEAWKKSAKRLKRIEVKTALIRQMQCSASLSQSFQALRLYKQRQQLRANKVSHQLLLSMSRSKSVIFSCWKRNTQSVKLLSIGIAKWRNTQYHINTLFALQAISRYAELVGQHCSWLQRHQRELISRAAVTMSKANMSAGFFTWKKEVQDRVRRERSVRRTVFAMKNRGLRTAFRQWRGQATLTGQWNYLEENGPMARRAAHLAHKLSVLAALFEREGVDISRAERFILERETRGSALISLCGDNYPHPLTRFFTLWKLFVFKRLRIRRTAKRMLAFHRHADLFAGFRAWKVAMPQYSKEMKTATKRELSSIVSRMERELQRVSSQERAIRGESEFLARACQHLQLQMRRGQNQSVAVLGTNIHVPMRRALYHWNRITKSTQLLDLSEQLTLQQRELGFATSTLSELKIENQALIDENSELRKSTMEGIAFAEALEVAGGENREIRLELKDRSDMIERLLEENQYLASSIRKTKNEEPKSPSQRIRYSQGY